MKKARAQLLAATVKRLADEAEAMSAATAEAQSRQITSRLVRGYHFASEGNERDAFVEFEHATRVDAGDIESRDIAAGSARRLGDHQRELSLLGELKTAKGAGILEQAIAWRREAELLDKRKTEPDWRAARDRLNEARKLLEPLIQNLKQNLSLAVL